MIKKLNPEICGILQPWYPDLDFGGIKIVQGGFIAWVFEKFFSAAAVTMSGVIHLTKHSCWKPDDPFNSLGLSLLVHELKHIEQQKKTGVLKFFVRYFIDWLKSGFKYSDKLPLEAPAYEIARKFLESDAGRTIEKGGENGR